MTDKIAKTERYVYDPKYDITTYELALIAKIAALGTYLLPGYENTFVLKKDQHETLHAQCQRHFERIEM